MFSTKIASASAYLHFEQTVLFSLELYNMRSSLNRDYFPKQQQSDFLHKACCLRCAVRNEQLKIIRIESLLQRVNLLKPSGFLTYR